MDTAFYIMLPNMRGHWGVLETAKPKKKNHPKPQKKIGQNRKPHTTETDTIVTSGTCRANYINTSFKVFVNFMDLPEALVLFGLIFRKAAGNGA